MKPINKLIYQADDGKIFQTAGECEKYEADIAARAKRTSYWRVSHNPDLTEGRGMYGSISLEVYGPDYSADLWVRDWCFRTFGRPIAFVQGVSPMSNWTATQIDREAFMRGGEGRVGDSRTPGTRKRLVCGPRETGLIEEDTTKERT
ncbi:hypothetical protein [Achromobacter aegrifaciens]|uniref:Uncharacterized protein n=1 Tax=Achromobacter aegrifaciens TaxID=1287736 RepID=A0AAD2IZ13_ACHAE|nr:hypothetical protein [Achromobacter aegrifaciens]CUJ01638.1 Uncharacterised protein [Achromobacter aegrifaciens]